jgi:hypothetical protein
MADAWKERMVSRCEDAIKALVRTEKHIWAGELDKAWEYITRAKEAVEEVHGQLEKVHVAKLPPVEVEHE